MITIRQLDEMKHRATETQRLEWDPVGGRVVAEASIAAVKTKPVLVVDICPRLLISKILPLTDRHASAPTEPHSTNPSSLCASVALCLPEKGGRR